MCPNFVKTKWNRINANKNTWTRSIFFNVYIMLQFNFSLFFYFSVYGSVLVHTDRHRYTNYQSVLSTMQVRKVEIYLFIIYHKNLLIAIWQQHFYHLVMWYRPKCLSINKRIYRNVSVLFPTIIQARLNRLSRQCMAFKLVQKDLRCNWNERKNWLSHTSRLH